MNTVLLEARPYRPFKSSEEYLYAMREDLAEWLNTLYPDLLINVDNFMERLDTGVALCKVSWFVPAILIVFLPFCDLVKLKYLKAAQERSIEIPEFFPSEKNPSNWFFFQEIHQKNLSNAQQINLSSHVSISMLQLWTVVRILWKIYISLRIKEIWKKLRRIEKERDEEKLKLVSCTQSC